MMTMGMTISLAGKAEDEGHQNGAVQTQQAAEGVEKLGAMGQQAHIPHRHVGHQPEDKPRRRGHRRGAAQHEQRAIEDLSLIHIYQRAAQLFIEPFKELLCAHQLHGAQDSEQGHQHTGEQQDIGGNRLGPVSYTHLLIALTYVVINLVIDILYGIIDPRVRYQ